MGRASRTAAQAMRQVVEIILLKVGCVMTGSRQSLDQSVNDWDVFAAPVPQADWSLVSSRERSAPSYLTCGVKSVYHGWGTIATPC
jgi:hypothetical protein